MNAKASALAVLTAGFWLLWGSGCAAALLYKPSFDLDPILALRAPDHINTLEHLPRDRTVVEDGVNQNTDGRQPNGIKDLVYVEKSDCTFRLVLFYSEDAAIRWYQNEKRFRSERVPVFEEISKPHRDVCVYYTEQPRADPEGGSVPMGYYVSQASLRLHNLFVNVSTQHDKPNADNLNVALRNLAQMLGAVLEKESEAEAVVP